MVAVPHDLSDHDAIDLTADLDRCLAPVRDAITSLRGARIFVTGGTGFVGTWLMESVRWANDRLGAGIRVVVLTRDPEAFATTAPHLAGDEAVELVRGDVTALPAITGAIDAVIHAATPASQAFNDAHPDAMVHVIVDGMRQVLDLAATNGRIPMLLTSSGAVYGVQPPELTRVPETYLGGPDPLDPRWAYHEGKRVAEMLGAIAAAQGRVDVKIGRLFAFVGPHLPIDRHFAVGNFLRDALAGGPIVVGGDGTPVRSYQYAGDMVAWLWGLLAHAPAGRAFNVGSDAEIHIAGTARAVAVAAAPIDVIVKGTAVPGAAAARYVPSVERATSELGLVNTVGFDEAVHRTLRWLRGRERA